MHAGKRVSTRLLVLLLIAGCGGSGSSGFDLTSENAAITQALEGNRCVASGELTICPSGASPTLPSPSGQPKIDIAVAPDGVVDCTPAGSTTTCSFLLPLTVQHVTPGTELRVAVRSAGKREEWVVGDALEALSRLSAAVTVELGGGASDAPPVSFQVAVLVFAAPPSSVPDRVRELAASAADVAFVTGSLTPRPNAEAAPGSGAGDPGTP